MDGCCRCVARCRGDMEPHQLRPDGGGAYHGAPVARRRGGWKPNAKAALPGQQWHVDALRASDNTLRGRVTLGGSPLAQAGNLVGKISDQQLSGNVVDDTGKQIVSFTGTITASGISGTYTDRTGETGNWSWDGPLPK